ncbi:MAG: tRNA (adenosine(37)-N6)-threonylcarbamoyltransferase complex dimerization subunit type 1 TsaB [Faecalibacillus sp.]
MRTIVMDSANKYLVVALYEDGQCIDKIQEIGNRKQSEYAIVYLDKLLKDHDLKVLDFDEIVITIGPGSYTGVRVALTIAKTIAAVSSIKIKTVSSLKALAGMKKAISIIDARSHKVFLGVYDHGQIIKEDSMIAVDELEDYCRQYSDYELVGDLSILGLEEKEVDLAEQIYQLSLEEKYVQEVDHLVPEYIKEVEAKKICQ